ncbi:MAG TPA: ribosome small subunit-dependent GTPase A [Candidatus Acidoferrales bacterium]|jgi:ribosome biogenesis GTPase|nr:ribosome small subunit-dependent GTPase A [Candidatus Acidoferrales bacterium]
MAAEMPDAINPAFAGLTKLGWNAERDAQFAPYLAKGLIPARVAVEDKHFYRVWTVEAELSAQITGKAMHEARGDHTKLPKVGDWVAVKPVPNEPKATIQAILPRRTQITRKTTGRNTAAQILATNIETVFLVTAADASFNAARLERMLVMGHESGARPVVILNKIDLCENLEAKLAEATEAAGDALVLAACALTGRGVKKLQSLIKPGDTVAFIGTSGVGKSSLINRLYGEELQATIEVREADAKGRHTTSWREMIFLPDGGVVIDTPGMREFHLWGATEGSKETFPEIEALAQQCHFRDCTHTKEKDCAVLAALAAGTLPRDRHESFVKLQLEIGHLREAKKQAGWQTRKKSDRVAHRAFNKRG